jgi:hypothetical protein
MASGFCYISMISMIRPEADDSINGFATPEHSDSIYSMDSGIICTHIMATRHKRIRVIFIWALYTNKRQAAYRTSCRRKPQ